jgi:hypothetical protein
MASKLVTTIRDASGETSTTSIEGAVINAGNFAAQDALQDALVTAIQGISVGHLFQDTRILDVSLIAGAVASPFAQRELKWLVSVRETANQEAHTFEIACPDAALLVSGSDLADLAAPAMAQFITDFEAYYRANGLGAATVESIRLVGRNI